MQLNNDFRELLSLLNSHRVEYLLIGGYAVVAHGYPRTTGDIDIFYNLGSENTTRLSRAMQEFGFEVSTEALDQPDVLFRMGVKPMMIELLSGISGLAFAQAWPNRIMVDVGDGLPVPTISLRDLRLNKEASGRTKDLLDLEELPEV